MNLPLGTVIICEPSTPKDYPWWKKWLLKIVQSAIQAYQRMKHPDSSHTTATHAMGYISEGDTLNVTFPKCLIEKFKPEPNYSYWRWVDADKLDSIAIAEMMRVARELEGKDYDVVQLGGFALQPVIANILKTILPEPFKNLGDVLSIKTFLGLGRTRTVCSAGAAAMLLAGYKSLKTRGIECRRPFENIWVEMVYPEYFRNSPEFVEVFPV